PTKNLQIALRPSVEVLPFELARLGDLGRRPEALMRSKASGPFPRPRSGRFLVTALKCRRFIEAVALTHGVVAITAWEPQQPTHLVGGAHAVRKPAVEVHADIGPVRAPALVDVELLSALLAAVVLDAAPV